MEKFFVPYELAVKLKLLGFDEPCVWKYYAGDIVKVTNWYGYDKRVNISHSDFDIERFEPATKTEYEQYLQTKTK